MNYIKKLQAEIAHHQGETKRLEAENVELRQQNARLKADVSSLTEKNESLNQEAQAYSNRIRREMVNLNGLQVQINELKEKVSKKDSEVQQARLQRKRFGFF